MIGSLFSLESSSKRWIFRPRTSRLCLSRSLILRVLLVRNLIFGRSIWSIFIRSTYPLNSPISRTEPAKGYQYEPRTATNMIIRHHHFGYWWSALLVLGQGFVMRGTWHWKKGSIWEPARERGVGLDYGPFHYRVLWRFSLSGIVYDEDWSFGSQEPATHSIQYFKQRSIFRAGGESLRRRPPILEEFRSQSPSAPVIGPNPALSFCSLRLVPMKR